MVEETQPSILEELSPSHIMTEVLSELTPQEEVAGSESGGGEEPHVAPFMVAEENIEDHRPVKESTDQLIRTTNHGAEEEELR